MRGFSRRVSQLLNDGETVDENGGDKDESGERGTQPGVCLSEKGQHKSAHHNADDDARFHPLSLHNPTDNDDEAGEES